MSTTLTPSDVTSQVPLDDLTVQDNSAQTDLTKADFSDDDLRDALLNILNTIEREEQPSRELLVKNWKYYDLLWEGIQPIFWNAVDREWQLIDKVIKLPNNVVVDPLSFNKSINIVRAYGESISGAISAGLPKVNYFPENADQIDDIKTAKAYSKIERIVAEHNQMELNLLKAAMTLWRFGFVAAYNYSHESEDYGTSEQPVRGDVNYTVTDQSCPNCGNVMSSKRQLTSDVVGTGGTGGVQEEQPKPPLDEEDKVDLYSGTDVTGDEALDTLMPCDKCEQQVQPLTDTSQQTVNEVTGFQKIPRARQIVEFHSPLEVKIPIRARSKGEVIWLILEEEFHYSQLRHKYPDYFNHIHGGESASASSYERWARSNYEIDGSTLENVTTLQRVWVKPDAFSVLDKDVADKLNKMYPEGVYFAVINNEVVEIKAESLDSCWTFSENPGDRRLLAIPPIKNIVPIQELTNLVMSLEVKCLKHTVPTAFADPEHFNFEAYRNTRKEPGQVFPMKLPPGGQPLQSVIAELRTSSLPKEAEALDAKLEKMAQFCSGAFPSIFGGPAVGSKTAYEYKESRNNALQRLGIIWKVISWFYASLMQRCIKSFVDNMIDDEFFTSKQGTSFINVWIKKAELQGRIGRVSPEVSEQFPTNWAQKKQVLTELLGMQNEMINSVIFHPENVGLLGRLIGLEDLYVPGDNDRNKQLDEIRSLVTSEPVIDPNTGQPSPSVQIDPQIDDANIHIEVMRAFACSDVGLYIKETNPAGWQNFMLHLQAHVDYVQQQEMQQQQAALAMQSQAASKQGQSQPAAPQGQDTRQIPPRLTHGHKEMASPQPQLPEGV